MASYTPLPVNSPYAVNLGQPMTYAQWLQSQGLQNLPQQQANIGNLAGDIIGGVAKTSAGESAGSGLSSLFGGGGGEAVNASYNIPSSYLPSLGNSAATEAISSTAPGFAPSLGSVGVLPLAAIAGATYLGGKNILDTFKGKEDKSIGGKIGRVTTGIATGGISELARLAGWGRPSTKQIQKERDAKLASKIPTFKAYREAGNANQAKANSAAQAQGADFVGFDPNGIWVNNKYKNTGDLNSLTVNDITGAQDFFDKYGNDWLGKMSLEDRNRIAQNALDSKAIGSKKGMITVDWSKFDANKPATAPSVNSMFKPAAEIPAQQATIPKMGLQPGDKMRNGKTYISPGVYR